MFNTVITAQDKNAKRLKVTQIAKKSTLEQ
jgi:hypothetical protein